jgi:hypothetical protein
MKDREVMGHLPPLVSDCPAVSFAMRTPGSNNMILAGMVERVKDKETSRRDKETRRQGDKDNRFCLLVSSTCLLVPAFEVA